MTDCLCLGLECLDCTPRRSLQGKLLGLPVEQRVAKVFELDASERHVPDVGTVAGQYLSDECSFKGCHRPRNGAKGLCRGHDKQWQRNGVLRPLKEPQGGRAKR